MYVKYSNTDLKHLHIRKMTNNGKYKHKLELTLLINVLTCDDVIKADYPIP